MSLDEHYMQCCLDLAIKGLGNVAPNPMVGCVIVHNGEIIGKGYHQKYGEAHAEVNAVNNVPIGLKHLIHKATLYVNLEPCSHQGKTPPCADMIVQQKIPRVIIGSNDPNPQVAGAGIQKLKDAGIEVITGVLKKESDFLNRRFLTFHTKHRPYIILKWAQSAYGFIAPNEPKQVWLTGDESKKITHQWRSEEPAILVGKRTVEIDNPQLTVRLAQGRNPIRITIDKELKLSPALKIFNDESVTYIFNELKNGDDRNINYVRIDFKGNVVEQILAHLASVEIQSLIVEGGANVLQQFIDQGLWEEARIFSTAHILKEGKASPSIKGNLYQEKTIGNDKLNILLNQ